MESSPGLMGNSVDMVAAGMKALLSTHDMFHMDGTIPPIVWKNTLYQPEDSEKLKSLNIGW